MNRAKRRSSIKRERPNIIRSFPFHTDARSQSLNNLYSYEEFLIDLIRYCTIKQRVYHPHIPTLIVAFLPIYAWVNHKNDLMRVNLSHCDTIICNDGQKYGAVLGLKLDPRLDHVINVQVLDGVEFGIGICDSTHLKKISQRDFMCLEGGYGYYNYKKTTQLKPKYPPGLYYHAQTCRKQISDAEICRVGDVITMVVQREKLPGGGNHTRSKFYVESNDPMDKLVETEKHTLSFYKNGQDMGLHLQNLKGPFYMCLNYYFVKSKMRLLSKYNFRRKYQQWLRHQSSCSSEQPVKREAEGDLGVNLSSPRMS